MFSRHLATSLARRARCASTRALLYFQSDSVPRGLTSSGVVGTNRDLQGSDGEFFGVDPVPTPVEIRDGRGAGMTLDENGFTLVPHAWDHIDYNDNGAIVNRYYAECEALVAKHTGATRVLAFDHNVRAKRRKQAASQLSGDGANAVQEPLVTYGVHNDYTLTSAPRRIEQLAAGQLGANDTLRARAGDGEGGNGGGAGGGGALQTDELDGLLRRRWCFVNVWRNIVEASPVRSFPLALCDAASVSSDDLVVFEIRYADRVGENYFVRHDARQRWWYYPELTRDEAVLIKCWDSRGADFLGMFEAARGLPHDAADADSAVPATFSLHSAFEDPASPPEAPDRESIEVRLVAFF